MLIVGCSNSASKDDISLTPSDKAEVVVKSEYVSRLTRLSDETLTMGYDEKTEKYDKKYENSKGLKEKFHGGDRDMYKDFTEGLSTFRTKDDELNELHDKLIEVSLDVYDLYKELIDLDYEKDNMYDDLESRKVKDFTDDEHEKMDEIYDRMDIVETMIENQEEHVENILSEMNDFIF